MKWRAHEGEGATDPPAAVHGVRAAHLGPAQFLPVLQRGELEPSDRCDAGDQGTKQTSRMKTKRSIKPISHEAFVAAARAKLQREAQSLASRGVRHDVTGKSTGRQIEEEAGFGAAKGRAHQLFQRLEIVQGGLTARGEYQERVMFQEIRTLDPAQLVQHVDELLKGLPIPSGKDAAQE